MIIDCLGQRCPLPVIALARAARDVAPGATLTVWSDDPASLVDVPAWCRLRGFEFVEALPLPTGGNALTVRAMR